MPERSLIAIMAAVIYQNGEYDWVGSVNQAYGLLHAVDLRAERIEIEAARKRVAEFDARQQTIREQEGE